jgi:hypothetical protein
MPTQIRPAAPVTQTVPSRPQDEPKPVIDLDNPAERFVVLSFVGGSGVTRATILDLKDDRKRAVREGDMLVDYKVVKIDIPNRVVEIAGKKNATFTLTRKKQ